MALSRRLARPLLASIFVVGGWDAFWNPAGKAKKAEAVTEPLAEKAGVTASIPRLLCASMVRSRSVLGCSWPSGGSEDSLRWL